MSVLLYGALAWLRASRALRVLQGVLVLGAVYVATRLFQLSLTTAALEALFVVVVVSAIVIFRDEVRLVVERIARFGRGRREGSVAAVLSLAESLFDLGHARTGALVVVEGRQQLDDLLEGGVELDGIVSDALVKSIFDPSSRGHDGALVLRAGRAMRFACHLPLSRNFEELGQRGTRHAAALGLSERSDALAIVVSEERGVVSIARAGRLFEVADAAALQAELEAFAKDVQPDRADRVKHARRLPTAIAALAIASVLWVVLVYGAQPVQRSYLVTLRDADLPPGARLARVSPAEVRVTLSGPRHEFFFVDEGSVGVILPLRDAKAGHNLVALSASEVSFPGSLTLKSISPSRVAAAVTLE